MSDQDPRPAGDTDLAARIHRFALQVVRICHRTVPLPERDPGRGSTSDSRS
ncbi:hypothetical protein [Actinocrispum sp. NPDC049592]|uniref:hypothetical protein n=1 Tax=Actinocrispum sp. NPDC049592 TaxID=3154835 RepID=UPI00342560AC